MKKVTISAGYRTGNAGVVYLTDPDHLDERVEWNDLLDCRIIAVEGPHFDGGVVLTLED